MILYPYVLPINHLSISYSSLCLSCNLSLAKDCNKIDDISDQKRRLEESWK